MASIRKRPRVDGSASYAVLYRQNGRQRSRSFSKLRDARDFKLIVETDGPDSVEPAGQGASRVPEVTEWVAHYIDHLTGVEQYTLDVYRRYLRNDINPQFGNLLISEISEEDIADWVRAMETIPSRWTGRVAAAKTIRNKHAFLSAALASAVGRHISSNPAAGRALPRKTSGEDEQHERVMLSRDEFDLLLSNVQPEKYRALVLFLVTSGCRWGEASALKPSDVDRDEGTVKIRRAWKNSSAGYEIGVPKTVRSRRIINLPSRVLDQLDYTGRWLFEGETPGEAIRYRWFKQAIWDPAVERSGLQRKPTPHALRHTCASWMLAAGVPITTVSRHLGHQNISVTADIYADVDRASHEAAAEAMERILE